MHRLILGILMCVGVSSFAFAADGALVSMGQGEYVLENVCQGKSGETVEKSMYQGGALKIKAYCKDGQFNGVVKKYNENGKIRLKGTYENGQLNGTLKLHDDNGTLLFREEYEKGALKGRFIYNEKGEMVPAN